MRDQPDGGPAFPRIANLSIEKMDGMTLHEYYAGQAIIGLMMRAPTSARSAFRSAPNGPTVKLTR